MTELEKLDALRQRMGIGYAEAKIALDAAGGDLIQALVNLERESLSAREQLLERGKHTWDVLKDGALKAGKARIRVKKGEKILFTIPAPVGAVGLVGALASTSVAVVGLAGTALALANKYTLEIDGPGARKGQEGFDKPSAGDI